MNPHPTDPAALHAAARGFGRLRARGLLGDAEIAHALIAAATTGGTRMRAMHTYMDSHAEHARRRAWAARALRAALAPALVAFRPAAVLLRLADSHDSAALAPGEARAIAAAEAARQLRGRA